jgi:hypothetical protein
MMMKFIQSSLNNKLINQYKQKNNKKIKPVIDILTYCQL